MAEEAKNAPQTQKPQTASPPPPLPEPDLDSLLAKIPGGLDLLFGDQTESGKAESPKGTEIQGAVEAPAPEAVPEITLPAAEPLVEEETPLEPAPAPVPEEPKPDAVQKRIDQLTAQKKSAEEKAQALEAELVQLKAKAADTPLAPMPTAENPLANITSVPELEKRFQLAKIARDWAREHLDGGEVDLGNGQKELLDGDQVKRLWSRAEKMVEDFIPRQYLFVTKKAEYDKAAKLLYPNLFKEGPEREEYKAWLRTVPVLAQFPDIAIIVGDAMRGRAMREAKSGKNGANGQSPPPLARSAPAASPRVPKSRALTASELSSIATDPNSNTLDRFVGQLIDEAAAQRSQQR